MVTTTSTSATWSTWVTDTTSTAATITDSYVWGVWCDGTASTTTTATILMNDDIWFEWTTAGLLRIQPITDEEQVIRNEKRKALQLEAAKRAKDKKEKATKLLRNALDRKQKKDFDKNKYFFVRGNKSGNLYKIKQGRAGNVLLLDKMKNVKQSLCAHPRIHCPDEDTMLTQKIMLEHMEDHFLDVANITYH